MSIRMALSVRVARRERSSRDQPSTEHAPAAAGERARMDSGSGLAFGTVLRRSRRAAGLTQEALAERAGISARTVSNLERGVNRAPHWETVALLAAVLELSPAERPAFVQAAERV